MLKHTKKTTELYEDIQKKIFYMIPEKWDSLYLYASVVEEKGKQTGELFFYYVPKGIFKKKPVNVYEIPAKFNIDEAEYLKLVEDLYAKVKELRQEFKKLELGETWSNVTMIIHNSRFMAEYHYEDLKNSPFSSYERHVIWRCKYLDMSIEQLNKEEKEILKKYGSGPKTLDRVERYDAGIYIKDIQNTVDYDTEQEETQEDDATATANANLNSNANANEASTKSANVSNKPKAQGEKIQTKRNQILGTIEDETTT